MKNLFIYFLISFIFLFVMACQTTKDKKQDTLISDADALDSLLNKYINEG